MDDFVRDKLKEWDLEELTEKFNEEKITIRSLSCLMEGDIEKLIPIIGLRAIFREKLQHFQEEQNTKKETTTLSAPCQQEHGEATNRIEVLPSTSSKGKRKLNPQNESITKQPPAKRQYRSAKQEDDILFRVKNTMKKVYTQLDSTKLSDFLKKKIKDLETGKRELVGVFGKTGAGKSSLINAVIGVKNLLPTGSINACTSVMINVEANMNNQMYEADIEFITKEEWKDELWSMLQFVQDDADEKQSDDDDDDDDDDYHDIIEKLSALYGTKWRHKTCEELMDNKYFGHILDFVEEKKPQTLTCQTPEDLSAKIVKYTRNDPNQGEGIEVKRWYWPLVKRVTVRVPHNNFLQHVTLVDLPGNGDRNKSRDKMWKEIVGNCSTVWIVTEVNRATSDKESWEILKNAASLLGNGGECQQIHFICTKSDLIDDSDDDSAAVIQDLILNRNKTAKDGVRKEFHKLSSVCRHFDDDCFQVFTVSSTEFLKQKCLSPDNTEIPKLQEFLLKLNDSHSETFNYVAGARGILSLIQGASLRNMAGKNEDVCEELERKIELQLEPINKSMKDAYTAFENCLSDGVQTSKGSWEKKLKSIINPPRRFRGGFHSTLKSVAKHGGIHITKKGKYINLNMALSSFLTDSIDEQFRKTFPNEVKCGPFISEFSLDTENLKQKYKDVVLQLVFLKTEEEKIKTKLSKTIRDRKKQIYSSLTETIEEKMKECYEEAATCTGKGTLDKMRCTIMKHVESKDKMFDAAKEAMLDKFTRLMEEIPIELKKTLKESIELSLKTDDHSIPDVASEHEMVEKLYDKLKKTSDEDEKTAVMNP